MAEAITENNIVQKIFLTWTFVQVFPKQKISNEIFFSFENLKKGVRGLS